MQCPQCRFDNPEGMKFCGSCGSELEMVCPQCSFANPVDFKFCGACGHDLKSLTKPPSIDYNRPQTYTPKFLADKILTNRNSIEGERKLVTVLFADVADYTAMSEKLDPEEVHAIMDGCFKILMDEIHKYEGTINQFTGDGVMALFGAPLAHEDHAQRACYAALAIQRAMGDYQEKVKREYGTAFQLRMGLNSGPVIVGAIGDDLRMDYTAVGDTTNLAARMEDLAERGTILVSQHTFKLARDFFELEPVGKVAVKGKTEAQSAYRLLQASEVKTRISASVSKGLTRFVGRRREMAALKEAFDKALAGSGQVVGISGEAGVGKSRLLVELRNMLPLEQHIYLEGRCLHYGGAMPYLPLLDILRSCFGIKEGEREAIIRKNMTEKVLALDENLKPVLAPFQDLLSLKVQDEAYLKLEPRQKRERTFEALRDLFIRLSQDRPLMLAIEDLHWIDQTSQAFLDYLIGWLANAPILLILLYRPEYIHTWGSKSYYTKIGVNQLSIGTSAELVQSILEGAEMAPELRDLILNRTAGIPLFMEEFTHSLLENGTIEKTDSRYVLSPKAASISIPDNIEGIIAARIDRLEENLKRTMQVASVIGREFAFRILQTITGMKEDLKTHLINLQGLEFIYEKRLFPELEYIFKHILTQEVTYNSLLVRRRKEIHAKISRAIEEIYAERLEEFYEMLAYHYLKSEENDKAYQYLKKSGNKATRNHSIAEAFQFYKDAIQILDRMPDTHENRKEKLEVLHLMTTPISLLGFSEDNLEFLLEGELLARELDDNRGIVIFSSIIGTSYAYQGKSKQGMNYAKNAFERARKIGDLELMARAVFNLCVSSFASGEYTETMDAAIKVIRLIEQAKADSEIFDRGVNVYSLLCAFCGRFMEFQGNFQRGEVFIQKGLKKAQEISEPRAIGNIEMHYGDFLVTKGDWNLAVEHLKNAIKYLEEVKAVTPLSFALSCLGYAYSFLGDFETCCNLVEKGIKTQIDAGSKFFLSRHYCWLSAVQFAIGDQEKALDLINEALTLAEKFNEKFCEGEASIWLGRILTKAGTAQRDKAENSILKGIQIFEKLQMKPYYSDGFLALGEFYADQGQTEMAIENLKRAEALFEQMGMNFSLAQTHEILTKVRSSMP